MMLGPRRWAFLGSAAFLLVLIGEILRQGSIAHSRTPTRVLSCCGVLLCPALSHAEGPAELEHHASYER
jgi:hypothetical protein